jgi:hypothetical protein
VAQSAEEFVAGLKHVLASFPASYYQNGRLKYPVTIVLNGHNSSGLGGAQTFLSLAESRIKSRKAAAGVKDYAPSRKEVESEISQILGGISAVLPIGKVRIENYSCFGFESPEDVLYGRLPLNWAMLLAMSGGGTYRAEPGESNASWENDSQMNEDAHGRRPVNIPAGATQADIAAIFAKAAGDTDDVRKFFNGLDAGGQERFLSRLSAQDREQFLNWLKNP